MGLSLSTILVTLVALGLLSASPQARTPQDAPEGAANTRALDDAQRFFYNGAYERATAVTHLLCEARPDDLEGCELQSASLLFQIKKAVAETRERDKKKAWALCVVCPPLMSTFLAETVRAQALARARLAVRPDDEEMLFFLGKMDLNYVWLQLGVLGRKTGWDEYWEARRSLDRVLRMNPGHVRARVARAWVDYIVGSTVPRGVRWILGGGNKKRGLLAVREVATGGGGEFFDHVEAMFALWDMQVREREVPAAIVTAQALARDFPENAELRRFLATHDSAARMIAPASAP